MHMLPEIICRQRRQSAGIPFLELSFSRIDVPGRDWKADNVLDPLLLRTVVKL